MRLIPRMPSVAPLCFFLISVSYKLAWTAISSLLSQYSEAYGPGILLQLNVAYFLPSIPVLMLQTAFNDRREDAATASGLPLLRALGRVQGGILNFELLTPGGSIFSYKTFEREAAAAGFHVRREGGYLNTCSYLVAPSLVPPGQKARASGLMTVAFQSACFGALLLAAAVQHWRLGPGMGHEAAAAAAAAVTH
ncbi:hypothetical protein TSOC_012042 [Tetrabaena socialis]|uniref:Uncharacterized protein n=1 Tax=Tetrabaena socialis TaxID=47790 RepID=A0A2J7ZP27_9CHLO|nr:hypothetical protein TSOC_012042 [Tetrabaena socialis]|eukprot:PNH02012.1 hypothetical protein TSOC_012042 [Tetrabaena socialis]